MSYYPILMNSVLALPEGGFPRPFAARRGYVLWCHHRLRRFVHRDGPTLPQLCQNYLLLCVRIGKLSESKAASDAWIHSLGDR